MKRSSQSYKNSPFLRYPNGEISFAEGWANVENWSGYWQKSSSKYIGLDLGDHPQYGLIQASAILAGKIPVHFFPDMSDEIVQNQIDNFGIDLLITDSSRKVSVPVAAADDVMTSKSRHQEAISSNDVCSIFFNFKRETGEWSPLPTTHKGVLSTLRGLIHVFNKPSGTQVFCDIPFYSSYGNLAKIWLPYFFRMTVFNPQNQYELVKEIGEGKVNTIFSDSASMASLLLDLDPSNWTGIKNIILGRKPLPQDLEDLLHAQGTFISETLGIDEVGAIIAINTPDHEVVGFGGGKPMLQAGFKKGSYGRPLPGVAIKIASKSDPTVSLEQMGMGQIMVKGAIVEQLGSSEQHSEGWLKTNEQGYLDEDGFLFVES